MARPLRIIYPGAFYHITSRGNEKKEIFRDQNDRERLISYFESATERYDAAIHAFCLMGNHYHLLLETPSGNLPQIMHHINGAYTTYFNVKYERVGHLFQGRYKAILVEKDEYAKELSRYIHLNPVRARIIEKPEEYAWSSYPYYIGLHHPPRWLHCDFILGYFGDSRLAAQGRYRAFVEGLVGREYESPLKRVVASTLLGSKSFIEEVKVKYLSGQTFDPYLPALRELSKKVSIEEIMGVTEEVFRKDRRMARGVAIYLVHKYTGERLREIGRFFGIKESGVSQASRRVAVKVKEDGSLKERVRMIENKLDLSGMKT